MSEAGRNLVVQGGIVVTMDDRRRVLEEGYVVIEDGSIVEVGARTAGDEWSGYDRLDAREGIILPGLVNAHAHLDQALYRGLFDDMVASERYEPMLRFAANQTSERAYAGARQCLLELTRSGVTTTTESYWVHSHPGSMNGICRAVEESRLRGVLARAMNDREHGRGRFVENWEDVSAEIDELNRRWGSDRVVIVPEAISILRTKRDTLLAMEDFARRRGTLWATHIATGDIASMVNETGRGLTHYLEDIGVLADNLLAAHCNVLYPGEAQRMADAGVRLAHAPVAQLWQGSPVADLMAVLAAGGRVGLGVDGPLTNNSQSMFESMKFCIYAQQQNYRHQLVADAKLALELATIRSAQALDMDDEVGSLERGKAGDLIVLDGNHPGVRPITALLANLVYSTSDEAVQDVVIGGEIVMKDRKHRIFDEHEVLDACEEAQRAMLSEAGVDTKMREGRRWVFR